MPQVTYRGSSAALSRRADRAECRLAGGWRGGVMAGLKAGVVGGEREVMTIRDGGARGLAEISD